MNFFKRHIGDYHKKAGRLTMLEHGAYTLLMDACYDRERFPTKEEALDWCWARSAEETAAVEFVLSKFFTLEDGVYKQARIQEEIDAYHAQAEKNREIALAREEARRKKREQSVSSGDDACTNRADEQTKESTNRAPVVHEPPPNHKPLTTNQEPNTSSLRSEDKDLSAPKAQTDPDDVVQVFAHWQTTMASPRSLLDDKRRKLIRNALKTGYSVDQLKQAIDGCAKSAWHMGQNDRMTKYNGLDLILRNAEQIDKFVLLAEQSAMPKAARPSEFDPSRYGPAGARSI